MKRVAVLMGGISSEREISLRSGQGVLQALNEAGYSAFPIDLTHNLDEFVHILMREKPDVVFNALHGKYGEDGCVQGVLNLLKIPYTHSGVAASAIAMNKRLAKKIARDVGLTVANETMIVKGDIIDGDPLPMPYVVKPNDEGSSVGVFIIKTQTEKNKMLKQWSFERPVMMEEYIPGIEISVAVSDEKAFGVVEIVPLEGFYDFTNKYAQGATEHIIPARIPQKIYDEAMQQALLLHKELGCRGVSRSDFRYDNAKGKERLVFLEINTNPGMTPISLVPELAKYQGLSYKDLVVWLVERAKCDE
ncbi:MAG: D-alanine--D-alanine ligase [Alphaproteobacteria bacterium]|nr:D-alanine--D-alanine ligase [Alphaproteobacteria bacterium]